MNTRMIDRAARMTPPANSRDNAFWPFASNISDCFAFSSPHEQKAVASRSPFCQRPYARPAKDADARAHGQQRRLRADISDNRQQIQELIDYINRGATHGERALARNDCVV
jgi:hypothetical protein